MISINVVKEQYSSMSDDTLVAFAINESRKLTIESFHALKEEFESRSLDLGVIEEAEADLEISRLNVQASFEESTLQEYSKTIWQYAFDEKANGRTNHEIYHGLRKKGVTDDYAFLLLNMLESKAREIIKSCTEEITAYWFSILAVIVILYFIINGIGSGAFLFYAAAVILTLIIKLVVTYNTKSRYTKILEIIEEQQSEEGIKNLELFG